MAIVGGLTEELGGSNALERFVEDPSSSSNAIWASRSVSDIGARSGLGSGGDDCIDLRGSWELMTVGDVTEARCGRESGCDVGSTVRGDATILALRWLVSISSPLTRIEGAVS
jgi:hypothetical protein